MDKNVFLERVFQYASELDGALDSRRLVALEEFSDDLVFLGRLVQSNLIMFAGRTVWHASALLMTAVPNVGWDNEDWLKHIQPVKEGIQNLKGPLEAEDLMEAGRTLDRLIIAAERVLSRSSLYRAGEAPKQE